MRGGAFLEQPNELGVEEDVSIRNLQTDHPIERGVAGEETPERVSLIVVHREDGVRPVEHARVDVDQRVVARAGRTNVERGVFGEDPLRRGAPPAVAPADEQDLERSLSHEFG